MTIYFWREKNGTGVGERVFVHINRLSSCECGCLGKQLLSDNLIMADYRLILEGDSIKTGVYSGRLREVVMVEEFSRHGEGNENVIVGNVRAAGP